MEETLERGVVSTPASQRNWGGGGGSSTGRYVAGTQRMPAPDELARPVDCTARCRFTPTHPASPSTLALIRGPLASS